MLLNRLGFGSELLIKSAIGSKDLFLQGVYLVGGRGAAGFWATVHGFSAISELPIVASCVAVVANSLDIAFRNNINCSYGVTLPTQGSDRLCVCVGSPVYCCKGSDLRLRSSDERFRGTDIYDVLSADAGSFNKLRSDWTWRHHLVPIGGTG